MEDGLVRPTEEGTPQGGPLSPLLSNLVLDELDKELERRGHRFCRYADDSNIYVRSHRAGDRVMHSVCHFLTAQLRLKVNVSKSAVARPEERKFLGFRISNDGRQRQIAPQALARFKTRVRELTRRTLGVSLPQLVEQLAPYLVGWRGYFGFCDAPRVLAHLDAWIRRRLRLYLWRQWQSGRHRFRELRRRGVSQFPRGSRRRVTDRVLADVQPPGRPASLAQSLFRLGRPSESGWLFQCITQSNRRGT